MLEDTQKQAGQAARKIADETILLFVITALSTPEPTKTGKIEPRTKKLGITGRPATKRRTQRQG